MNLEIVPLTPDKHGSWDDLCSVCPEAWLRHTTGYIEYSLNCRFDSKSKDLSFFVYEDGRPVALVPLMMQTVFSRPDIFEFAMHDTNTPFPALFVTEKRARKELLKMIFEEIDSIASKNGISYSRFFVDPLTASDRQGGEYIDHLMRSGYSNTSITTNMISLGRSEDDLIRSLQKGHKCDIKYAEKTGFSVEFFTGETVTEDLFGIYRQMHLSDAGRKTRPDKSWEIMLRLIRAGQLILALGRIKDSKAYYSGTLCCAYRSNSYNMSFAADPAQEKARGMGVFLYFELMRHLKQAGFRFYEMGWNAYPVISQDVSSSKERDIAHFKRGFGGAVIPLIRAEKFYSKEYFLNVWQKRASDLSSIIP